MLPISKMNKAQREIRPAMRFRWLPFLLAIALGYLSGIASVQAAAGDVFMGLSSRQHHCCQIVTGNTDRPQTGSEDQIPCTCRSQYDEQLRTAVSPDSLRWLTDNGSSVLQQGTLSAETQTVMPTFGGFPANPTPIYILFACLLI